MSNGRSRHRPVRCFRRPPRTSCCPPRRGRQVRCGFGNELAEEESDALYEQWSTPAPARPLFQAAAANFVLHSEAKVNTANEHRGPLLLISGKQDHTVPDVTTRSTLKQYRDSTAVTELRQFEGRGHSLTIEIGRA